MGVRLSQALSFLAIASIVLSMNSAHGRTGSPTRVDEQKKKKMGHFPRGGTRRLVYQEDVFIFIEHAIHAQGWDRPLNPWRPRLTVRLVSITSSSTTTETTTTTTTTNNQQQSGKRPVVFEDLA